MGDRNSGGRFTGRPGPRLADSIAAVERACGRKVRVVPMTARLYGGMSNCVMDDEESERSYQEAVGYFTKDAKK